MWEDVTALLTRPAVELAELVRTGQVRSRELVEAALRQIGRHADLNAFTLVEAEQALAAAGAVPSGDPRPFAGVPIAIKELNPVAGQRLTLGSDLFGEDRPAARGLCGCRPLAGGAGRLGAGSPPRGARAGGGFRRQCQARPRPPAHRHDHRLSHWHAGGPHLRARRARRRAAASLTRP